MRQSISIKNVIKKEKTIEVNWSDGKISNFHFMWLRDNCPSDIHPTARERLFNLMNVTENIRPESCKIDKNAHNPQRTCFQNLGACFCRRKKPLRVHQRPLKA